MKNILAKVVNRESLNCGSVKNIMECPGYWEKLATVS